MATMARILVVEDDDTVARVISRCVRRCGHEALTATNGRDAMYGLDGVELVITDIDMPEMDGLQLIAAVREKGGVVPVIAMSGGADSDVVLGRAAALGAVHTLEKPFGVDVLRRAIEAALGGDGSRGPT